MAVVVDLLYLVFVVLLGPFYLLARLVRGKPITHFARRLGGAPRRGDRPVIWIHGVSVGEILSARGLVEQWVSRRGDIEIVLSTTTRTGYDVACRTYPDHRVFYCPLDLSMLVRRAMRRLAPDALVLMELELWPNLLGVAGRLGVPIFVAGGKISATSTRGYRRALRWWPGLLAPVRLFAMQNEAGREALKSLGVGDDRIRVTGNLKADNLAVVPDEGTARDRRKGLGMMGRPVWIAGSTHEGEEEMILQAHREIASRVSNVGLILAPRHPERLPRVGTMLSRDGLDWALLTEVDAGVRSPRDLILIDTMGELTALFGTADVVFLGGSLVPVGGHNILEPAAAGRVVVVGPHTWTVQDLVGEMIEQGAARRVADAAELSEVVIELLGDEEQRGRCGVEARRLCDGHRGAVGRTLDAIFESLGSD